MLALSQIDVQKLAQIIRDLTGNRIDERNFFMIESKMRTRILNLKLSSSVEYWSHYERNTQEENDVILSLMTTHYTYFFREFVHFEILEKWISREKERLKARYIEKKEPLRIWSAACSRGQEAYSLAVFLEAKLRAIGLPYVISATDIDPASIAYAKNGVYPLKEVNTIPRQYLSDVWRRGSGPIKDFIAVHDKIKSKINFELLNLLYVPKWSDKNIYDVIFCRNVFIYFESKAVEAIALSLTDRLAEDGLFVSGLSEPLRFEAWDLKPIGNSCYEKRSQSSHLLASTSKDKGWAAGLDRRKVDVAASHSSLMATKGSPVKTQDGSANRYKILCVDDSVTIQKLMVKLFGQDPMCELVDIANNGLEAREKLDTSKYDLITLDIHMPVVNGIMFLEKLYKRYDDPPVIMVSSVNRTDLDLAIKSMSLGAFDYVEKPSLNNLQRCSAELLVKVKMALRSRSNSLRHDVNLFDKSVGQKIVVPDASQCLRVVLGSSTNIHRAEHVVRFQNEEYRSPPILIYVNDLDKALNFEADLLKWTEREVFSVRGPNMHLRPNRIYTVGDESLYFELFKKQKFKSISFQILDTKLIKGVLANSAPNLQILLDESVSDEWAIIEKKMGIKVSDIVPATSFSRLSLEFFANMRKAVA